MIVNYDYKPEAVLYMKLPNGLADVWLRRNIQQEECDDCVFWSAEEKYIRTGLTLDEVNAQFDALFDAEPETPLTDSERIAQLEQQNAMLTECLLEMSEIVYG